MAKLTGALLVLRWTSSTLSKTPVSQLDSRMQEPTTKLGRRHADTQQHCVRCASLTTRFLHLHLRMGPASRGRTSTQAVVTRTEGHASQRQSGRIGSDEKGDAAGGTAPRNAKQRLTRPLGRLAMKPKSPMSVLLAASGPNLFSKCRAD